jgi:hypothetical protein
MKLLMLVKRCECLLAVLLIAVATLVMPLVVVMMNDKMWRMVLLMERQLEELRRLRRE